MVIKQSKLSHLPENDEIKQRIVFDAELADVEDNSLGAGSSTSRTARDQSIEGMTPRSEACSASDGDVSSNQSDASTPRFDELSDLGTFASLSTPVKAHSDEGTGVMTPRSRRRVFRARAKIATTFGMAKRSTDASDGNDAAASRGEEERTSDQTDDGHDDPLGLRNFDFTSIMPFDHEASSSAQNATDESVAYGSNTHDAAQAEMSVQQAKELARERRTHHRAAAPASAPLSAEASQGRRGQSSRSAGVFAACDACSPAASCPIATILPPVDLSKGQPDYGNTGSSSSARPRVQSKAGRRSMAPSRARGSTASGLSQEVVVEEESDEVVSPVISPTITPRADGLTPATDYLVSTGGMGPGSGRILTDKKGGSTSPRVVLASNVEA